MWIIKNMSLRKRIYRYITPKKLSEEFEKIKNNEDDYLFVFDGSVLRTLDKSNFKEIPDLEKNDVEDQRPYFKRKDHATAIG